MVSSEYDLLNKLQKQVVLTITLGNILEWYDIYLYIYWAPNISRLFFGQHSESLSLFNTVAFFALGFFFRPLGGIFFGRLGDHIGRKNTFILSIIILTIPTFLLGILPVYSQIGIAAPILLALIRILQTFPSGGELPGVFCYLYENASPKNLKFMTSFAGVGNQLGIALSALECFLFEKYFSPSFLINWGWRISFIVGGVIGLTGYYLRYKLHETKLFREMIVHHKMTEKSIFEVIAANWKKVLRGISYGASQTVSFHVVVILFPIYVYRSMGLDLTRNSFFSILIIFLMTLPLPIFGFLGDRYGPKKILLGACIGMLGLLYPLYLSMHGLSMEYTVWIIGLYILCFTSITALWPYLISDLFLTSERYTCVGITFNIADGIFGGFSILLALYLFDITNDPGVFVWMLLVSSVISFMSFIRLK